MFAVGDKVVYPMHGAGVIEAIEEKEVLGEKRKYYVLHLPLGQMRVLVPLDNVEESGLRQVIDEEGCQQVLEILKERSETPISNWNHRYRAHMEKIKSGDIFEVAEVVRNLSLREKEKGLSTGEKKMLENARQILISEIVLAKDKEEAEVIDILDQVLA